MVDGISGVGNVMLGQPGRKNLGRVELHLV